MPDIRYFQHPRFNAVSTLDNLTEAHTKQHPLDIAQCRQQLADFNQALHNKVLEAKEFLVLAQTPLQEVVTVPLMDTHSLTKRALKMDAKMAQVEKNTSRIATKLNRLSDQAKASAQADMLLGCFECLVKGEVPAALSSPLNTAEEIASLTLLASQLALVCVEVQAEYPDVHSLMTKQNAGILASLKDAFHASHVLGLRTEVKKMRHIADAVKQHYLQVEALHKSFVSTALMGMQGLVDQESLEDGLTQLFRLIRSTLKTHQPIALAVFAPKEAVGVVNTVLETMFQTGVARVLSRVTLSQDRQLYLGQLSLAKTKADILVGELMGLVQDASFLFRLVHDVFEPFLQDIRTQELDLFMDLSESAGLQDVLEAASRTYERCMALSTDSSSAEWIPVVSQVLERTCEVVHKSVQVCFPPTEVCRRPVYPSVDYYQALKPATTMGEVDDAAMTERALKLLNGGIKHNEEVGRMLVEHWVEHARYV